MFGSNPFGQPGTSPFGAQPAFGQQNTATNNPFAARPFGSTSPFGAQTGSTLFGGNSTGVFGVIPSPPPLATSTPAFAASSAPAFGSNSSPFGGVQSTTTFGSPGFGQTPFGGQRGGSRVAPYTTTIETDSGSSVSGQTTTLVKILSISAMPQYKEKSHEELRLEDYQLGDKGRLSPASQQPAGSLFSQPTQSSPFGQTTPSPSAFGQTREVERENLESAITLKEIMEQLKEKVEQLTSYVQYLVGPIQCSAPMPTLPFVNVADKDMPPAGEIGRIVKATKSWMEDLVVLGSKLIDEAVILYHKIHDELNNLADMNKKFDEELQGLEWSLPQIKEMMKIDFDIHVAEEIVDGSDPSLPIEWLKATEWRIEILEEGKTRFKEVDGIAHEALVDIQDFIEKIPCDFYDDQRSVNSAGVMKDQLAKIIKEEESVLDVAAVDRLMKLKTLCWNFEKKLIKCRQVSSEVSNIHISQDMRFRYSKGPNQEAVKEAIHKFRQYQKRVCNNEKGTINTEDSQGECSH